MFAPPGSPDVLALANLAYQLYDTYKGAPERFKQLSDDISGLDSMLKVLGNRLVMQEAGCESRLAADESAELERLVKRTESLLSELQKKAPPGQVPRGLRRLKWSQADVDSIRARIATLCSTIAAFNSSILLPRIESAAAAKSSSSLSSSSATQILHALDDILINVQRQRGRSRAMSTSSTLVDDGIDPISSADNNNNNQDDLWRDLLQEMQKHGISETQADKHRQMILHWAAEAAAAGILSKRFDQGSALSDASQTESCEVLSAVYGPAIVTDVVQRIFDAHVPKNGKLPKVYFAVTNENFGCDPLPGRVKAFSMIWRKTMRRGSKALHSRPQKTLGKEGDSIIIDLGIVLACADSDPTDESTAGSVQVISASWHDRDVTERIAAFVQSGQSIILATAIELFSNNFQHHKHGDGDSDSNIDPCPGGIKILSVTWTYLGISTSQSQFKVSTAWEGQELEIPPYLNILCANWGGLDITAVLQTRKSPRQTLELDTDHVFQIFSPDPWPYHQKTISVVYRYGSSPLQLLVVAEGSGLVVIRPYQSVCRSLRWKLDYQLDDDTRVLATIWGLQPVPRSRTLEKALKDGEIPCSNQFFGGDGWGGVNKTCQIFLQDCKTGEVTCTAGREQSLLKLSS